jgi:hypothetical protein
MRRSLGVLPLLITSSFLAAQTPIDGVYPSSTSHVPAGGPGVQSSVVSCLTQNWNDVPAGNVGVLGNFAILANSGPNGVVVCGVELFIGTVNGTTVTTNLDLYDRPAAAAPGTSLGSTTMTVTGVVSPHTATFAIPIQIQPNTDFFIVLDNRPNLRLPLSMTGGPGTHYFNGPPTWNGPFSGSRWSYRILCCGDLTSGVYTTYGAGCTGTGSGSCLAVNQGLPHGWVAGQPFPGAGNYALLANSGAATQVICSVDLVCLSLTGAPSTNSVWIYDRPVAGGPPGVILATSSMNVGVLPAPCNAAFTPPVVIPAGTDYFIVFDNRPALYVPVTTAPATNVTHFFGGPPAWTGPLTNTRWSYSVNCCGQGAVPVLSATGRPRLGGSFNINLTKAPPTALALLFTGFSNTNWLGIPLPLDLTVAGAPGCNLLAPGTMIGVTVASTNGDGTLPFGIPADASLHAAHFYQQWLVQDPTVNALGFTSSQGGDGRIGD